MNDFEYIYMIRQDCECAYQMMLSNYESLLWKISFKNYHIQKPEGIQVFDLVQEAHLGFMEALYTYSEAKFVGLAFYIKLCCESHVLTLLRKCRSLSYKLLDTSFSLDVEIAEGENITLMDVIPNASNEHNPSYQAVLSEARNIFEDILNGFLPHERDCVRLWLDGHSYKEIADIVFKDVKDVDNTLQKIKRMVAYNKPFS